jgi:hypothetical protein
LLAAIGVVAVLLGAWRALGPAAALSLVAVAVLTALVERRLFVWLAPLLWTTVAWFNFQHPGDEYGGFAAGSLAGLWIVILFDVGGSPANMLPLILGAGAVTVAIAGLVLDKLRAPPAPWLALLVVFAVGLCLWELQSYPSMEKAISKNGSYAAYVLPGVNLGLYAATIATAIGTAAYRLWRRRRKGREMSVVTSPQKAST